jgi:hypothetical protein
MYVGTEEVKALAGLLSASLSKRLAANTALLEFGTVPADLGALLTVIDKLSAYGVSVIGDDNPLTPAECIHAATLALRVRRPSLHAIAPYLPPDRLTHRRIPRTHSCAVMATMTMTIARRARASHTVSIISSYVRPTPWRNCCRAFATPSTAPTCRPSFRSAWPSFPAFRTCRRN